AGSQVPVLDSLERWTVAGAALLTQAGLLRAVEDSLTEADDRLGKRTPERMAEAHEAASQLSLYLRHMASDFRAIDDLTSDAPGGKPESPAHFDGKNRDLEVKLWERLAIEVRSYVTLGSRPFAFATGRPAPPWDLAKPWTYPEIAKDHGLSMGTDMVYRLCY